jgi:hypothetical protein
VTYRRAREGRNSWQIENAHGKHMLTMGPSRRGHDGCGVMLGLIRLRGDDGRGAVLWPLGARRGFVHVF